MIYPCVCKNDFQDSLYGKGRRVYNVGKVNKVCTVCGNKATLSDSDRKISKDKEEKSK